MREAEFFLYHGRIRRYAVLAIPESLPREKNVAQVSSKHNEYQLSFISSFLWKIDFQRRKTYI